MRIVIAMGSFGLVACVKTFHEKRLGEETWEVGYTDIAVCDKAVDESACINALRPKVAQRAQELCGARLTADVQSCAKDQRRGLYAVVCRVVCTEDVKTHKRVIPIRIAENEIPSFEQSVNEFRTLIHSQQIKKLFAQNAIGSIARVSPTEYVLVAINGKICVNAETKADSNGEIVLTSAQLVDCSSD